MLDFLIFELFALQISSLLSVFRALGLVAGKGGVVMENFTKALVEADYGYFGESMNGWFWVFLQGVSRYHVMASQPTPCNVTPPRNKGLIRPYVRETNG